jgi:EAL domain-containing protein (putative c-di-GMP-specific phosphodiesterase class I)
MTLLDTTEQLRRHRALLEELIEDPSRLGPDFQPVRRLSDDDLVGLKATGRGQAGTELSSTLALLESAQATGLVERLDWAFRCLALDVALEAGVSTEVLLTPEPETYGSPCPPRLATAFGRGRRALRVAAEVPVAAFERSDLEAAVAEFRGWGWRIVVDDVADLLARDPDALRRLTQLRPDVVKLDLTRPGRSTVGTAAGVHQLVDWAQGAGVEVLAVGVDTQVLRGVATDLGATLGRGRLLGVPGPL